MHQEMLAVLIQNKVCFLVKKLSISRYMMMVLDGFLSHVNVAMCFLFLFFKLVLKIAKGPKA